MNFMKLISKKVEERNIKLYREAEEPDVGEEETPPEPEPTETATEEAIPDETGDIGEDEFNFDDNEIIDDSGFEDNEDLGGMDEENMFTEGEDEETSQFRRRAQKLIVAYSDLYAQYYTVLDKLKSIDATGDRARVLDAFIEKYKKALKTLEDYTRDCDDPWTIRYETFVKFRALFISINEQLKEADNDTTILQG